MHVKRLKCDFLSPMQQLSVMQMSLSLITSLIKATQLSKVGLSTIKHQHSKNLTRWTEAT